MSWLQRLNGPYHERAMQLFAAIVIAHWAEHIAQGVQFYFLGWAASASKGVLGLWWPWLATSEWLHYAYALVMLAGLWLLLPGMAGRARLCWRIAFAIQAWHHVEHFVLLWQAASGQPWFGAAVPTSFAQLVVPRIELHLLYNSMVTIPMVMAMVYHIRPPKDEPALQCTCAKGTGARHGHVTA